MNPKVRAIGIRGAPEEEARIYNNWFAQEKPGPEVIRPWPAGGRIKGDDSPRLNPATHGRSGDIQRGKDDWEGSFGGMIRMIPSGLDDWEGSFGGMIRMIPSGLDDLEGKGVGAEETRVLFYDNAFGRERPVVFE